MLSPRPMWRAASIAAASVTRTISSASRLSMLWLSAGSLMAVVPLAGEDHRQMVTVRDIYGHLIANRSARLDDCSHAAFGRELDRVGEWEVRVGCEHGEL